MKDIKEILDTQAVNIGKFEIKKDNHTEFFECRNMKDGTIKKFFTYKSAKAYAEENQ